MQDRTPLKEAGAEEHSLRALVLQMLAENVDMARAVLRGDDPVDIMEVNMNQNETLEKIAALVGFDLQGEIEKLIEEHFRGG